MTGLISLRSTVPKKVTVPRTNPNSESCLKLRVIKSPKSVQAQKRPKWVTQTRQSANHKVLNTLYHLRAILLTSTCFWQDRDCANPRSADRSACDFLSRSVHDGRQEGRQLSCKGDLESLTSSVHANLLEAGPSIRIRRCECILSSVALKKRC